MNASPIPSFVDWMVNLFRPETYVSEYSIRNEPFGATGSLVAEISVSLNPCGMYVGTAINVRSASSSRICLFDSCAFAPSEYGPRARPALWRGFGFGVGV